MEMNVIIDMLIGIKYFLIYMFSLAGFVFIINKVLGLPKELFRKLLHFIAFSSVIVMIYTAKNWISATLVPIFITLLMYPGLLYAEKNRRFTEMVVERRKGELKSSLLQLFGTIALVIALNWGILGHKELAVAAILMWGFGDAAAALIGKKFGKHKVLRFKYVDHKKSWEGTAAMSIVAFVFGLASLMIVGNVQMGYCIAAVVIAAPLAAITELITRNGYDTVTVPLVCTCSLYFSYIVMGVA
jgi:dolichol kinase